jgi:nucleoside-diphosphate-sugar epimerase
MERGRPGESYIIAGPPHTFREAMEIAARITGLPAPRLHPGPRVMRAMAAVMDLVGAVVPLPPAYAGESLRVTAGVTYLGSSEKARRDLGFTARPLEVGLRETLEHEMRLMRRDG